MTLELQNTKEAARRMGITVATFYDWIAHSRAGTFAIRNQPVTIQYYQGGRRGQGRIKIEPEEIERLLSLMRVKPQTKQQRRAPTPRTALRHITATLGRPKD